MHHKKILSALSGLSAESQEHDHDKSERLHRIPSGQSEVSRIEKRNDLHLSTLRGYVEGLGGKLELTAVFPEGEVIALAVAPSKKGNAMRVANKGFRGPARWKRVASSGLAAPAKRVRHSPQAASR
jgi:hypothetical protein